MRAKKCKTTDAKIDNVQSENEEEQNLKNITWHDQNVNKHTEQTDEPDNISINEAQTEFDKLFVDEMIKLDATVQKHIIGMDTVLSEELFDEFKKASSIAEKSEVEKLLRKVEINKKSSSALHTEMLKMQTKTNVNNLKINIYLKQIESLEKKLQETQSKVAEMKPMSNVGEMVGEMEVERTPTAAPIIPIAEHVKNDVNEGKQSVTETKEKTRTLVRNVRARNDRKQTLDPGFEYEQTLDPVNEKEKEEDNNKDESTLKIKVEATQVQATKGELPPKACLKSNLKAKKKETMKMTKGDTKSKCPSSTWAYKLLDQEIKEKIKDYYRQCKLDYFWLMPKIGSMATELVVLKSDLTSLFVNGPIDAKVIDAFFYIKSENEMKEGKEQNLYISSYIFNDMEIQRPKSDDEYLDQRLQTILEENVDKVGKVFIPMKHYFHFTLIVWDIKEQRMTHYNSKLPRIEGGRDQYFDHALQVRDKIQTIYKHFKSDSTLTIDIESYKTCAQQQEDSLDCGIFVIHYAQQVQEGKLIEPTFDKKEVFKKRAEIITTLVNHANSYSNGLQGVLEQRRKSRTKATIPDGYTEEDIINL
ncbi:hypothetical protein ACFX13_037715 [Malus domestica]